jgi:hypothetical protein
MSFVSRAGPHESFIAEGDPELAMRPNSPPVGTLRAVVGDSSRDEIHDVLVNQQTRIATFRQLSSPNGPTAHSNVRSSSVVHLFFHPPPTFRAFPFVHCLTADSGNCVHSDRSSPAWCLVFRRPGASIVLQFHFKRADQSRTGANSTDQENEVEETVMRIEN